MYGGIFREEAIMLLRRFYIQENEKGELKRRPRKLHLLTCFQLPILDLRSTVNLTPSLMTRVIVLSCYASSTELDFMDVS